MLRRASVAKTAVAVVAVAALTVGGAALAGIHAQAAAINVTINDRGIQLSGAPSVGGVTLVVRNTGKAPHQLVVLKTSSPPRALPMSGKRARETGLVGKTTAIIGGAVKKLTIRLGAGKYVLLSNLPGDYARGLAVGLTVAGPTTTSPGTESTVDVSGYEMGFKLSTTTVPHGNVTFKVHNDGKAEHDFRIEGKGTATLEPGEAESLTVALPKPGKYLFLCTIPGHAAAGMRGTLTVT